LDFYTALGIDFVEERHGEGPVHYAARVGATTLELYPLPGDAGTTDGSTRLGFAVPNLETVLRSLEEAVVSPVMETPWGRRAVVRDPDGRAVELVQG